MLTASTTMSAPTLPIVRAEAECLKQFKPIVSVGLQPLGMQSQFINNGRHLICPVQEKSASIICVAALSARCATKGQMQTLTRENSTITVAPGNFFMFFAETGGTKGTDIKQSMFYVVAVFTVMLMVSGVCNPSCCFRKQCY
uniref:Uncharacterized protein n=1 Tax=Nicotiana tabacum TaxID=4097 RepID=A0A1S4CN43_TOBAC|nr:PREDICTED: uncharacterized protein LOC107820657 [Nicotiana tabacum]XP_016502466.1 PREDICTED: uncharacterized protein LOC107820657 [Nicotiana tabacum]